MDTSKDITDIKARLDRIEKWIHAVVQQDRRADGKTRVKSDENDPSYDLVSLDVKEISGGGLLPSYAYKLQLRNLTDQRIILAGKLAFLDEQGFELDNFPIGPITIPSAQLISTSGKATLLSSEFAGDISEIKAVLHLVD